MKRIYLFLSALFLAFACNDIAIEETPSGSSLNDSSVEGLVELTPSDECSITASIGSTSIPLSAPEMTRISVNTSGEVWKTVWDSGDRVTTFIASDASSLPWGLADLAQLGYSEEVCTFQYVTGVEGNYFRLMHFPDGFYDADGNAAAGKDSDGLIYPDLDLALQDEGLTQNYMISEEYTLIESSSYTMATDMVHLTTAIDLRLRFENPTEALRLKGLTFSGLPTRAYIDLRRDKDEAGIFNNTDYTNLDINIIDSHVVQEYDGTEATEMSIKFNVLPFSINGGRWLEFVIALENEAGETIMCDCKVVNNSNADAEFKRGTYNRWYSTCDLNPVVDPDPEVNDFTVTFDCIETTNSKMVINMYASDPTATYVFAHGLAAQFEGVSDDVIMSSIMTTLTSNNILADRTKVGDTQIVLDDLEVGETYTLFAFEIDSDNNPVSALYSFTGTTLTYTGSDTYKKWIGTWNATSAGTMIVYLDGSGVLETYVPVTVPITIKAGEIDKSYKIYGLDIVNERNDYAVPATFDAATGNFTIPEYTQVGDLNTTDGLYYIVSYRALYSYDYYGQEAFSYSYDTQTIAMTGSIDSSDSNSGYIAIRSTLWSMLLSLHPWNEFGHNSLVRFYVDSSFGTHEDAYLKAPFTLTKTSSSAAPAALSPSKVSAVGTATASSISVTPLTSFISYDSTLGYRFSVSSDSAPLRIVK